ncbi:hypothetical protein [Telluribacter humicola]|uniref:hypothetical protein n=1 Tax=Telluribacter humicola TaxID=1720261 RepID=UPI001A95F0C7|nr:hypothetical protein [Telluribacter humicola]
MKMYRGTAPCPGCDRPGLEDARPTKNGLCFNCFTLLRLGRKQQLALDILDKNEFVLVRFRTCLYWLTIDGRHRVEELDKAIVKIFQSVAIPGGSYEQAAEHLYIGLQAGSYIFEGVITRVQYEAVKAMVGAINIFISNHVGDIRELEEKAFKAGQNLLLSLNNDPNFLEKTNYQAR